LIPLVVDEKTGKLIADDGVPVLDAATLAEVAEYLRVHGVRDHDDRPAVVSQIPHLLHDRLVQARIEPGGRLVQQEQ
jgi:hypothetical protein